MRKMSGTVQSIMNLYSRKHVMDGMRIDVKMAELKKELDVHAEYIFRAGGKAGHTFVITVYDMITVEVIAI